MPRSLLALFPVGVHPLTLVSDPDSLLAAPPLRMALAERGMRIVVAADPIALRRDLPPAQPFSLAHPVIIVTDKAVNTLPYDLWQAGRHLALSLAAAFPGLTTSVVRDLTPAQRWRLGETLADAPLPADDVLSADATRDLALRAVFDLDIRHGASVARLVAWLDEYHRQDERLPPALVEHVVTRLSRIPAVRGWPLADLFTDSIAFRRFLGDAWAGFVRHIAEPSAAYAPPLRFAEDTQLQALLPRLVASGVVPRLAAPGVLPDWAQPAFLRPSHAEEVAAYREQLTALEAQLAGGVSDWGGWQDVARRWAALTVTRYSPDLTLTSEDWQRYRALQTPLDSAFLAWLQGNYSRLATLALPTPHHVYHVPGWLAHHREADPNRRVALLIVDGLALADWSLIRDVWTTRQPAWTFRDSLLLAQIPTITAISRQALVRGQRPAQFAGNGLAASREAQGWREFWTARGLPDTAVVYAGLSNALNAPYPPDLSAHRVQALCLVTTVIDDLVHGATLGTAEVFGSLRVWLHQSGSQQGSPWLEGLVQQLLDRGYTVTLISDHGHVEAVGAGLATARGLSVSRGQRALLFDDLALASLAPDTDPPTILWHDDGLLPANLYIVMPRGRAAFTSKGSRVVSHGGASIEEMVVPLVTIEGR